MGQASKEDLKAPHYSPQNVRKMFTILWWAAKKHIKISKLQKSNRRTGERGRGGYK